jgi:WS/DGAT/MGAT family acyltransferase
MEQLSGLDSMFLTSEDSRQHMHIASLALYDPSSAPGGKVRFKQILDFFAEKADELPLFRKRLAQVPFELDHPFWVDGGDVAVEYHVRHIALPKPGDWRQLMIQVARLHSRSMDRTKPLWEAYVIEGLGNIEGLKKDSFALYLKTHHAAVDGQAGAQLINSLHTLTPELAEIRSVNSIVTDRDPSVLELGIRSFAHRGKQALQAGKLATDLSKTGFQFTLKKRADVSAGIKEAIAAMISGDRNNKRPRNRFDQKVSPHRSVDAVGLPFSDCQTIRALIPSITINDIFLATAAGAVRHYLSAHGELTEHAMHAMMPIAVASKKDVQSANNVTSGLVCLHTELSDPLLRLKSISKSAVETKQEIEELGPDLLPRVANLVPNVAMKAILERTLQDKASITVSNVRGPSVDLYLAGAKCQMFVPVSIPTDGVGLNLTGFSYKDTLWVCATSCREMLPDPAFFIQCLEESFQELVSAAEKAAKKSN